MRFCVDAFKCGLGVTGLKFFSVSVAGFSWDTLVLADCS